jgi:hypothetical protein
MIMQARRLMAKKGKMRPIIFEEHGLDYNAGYSANSITAYFDRVYQQIYKADVAGTMVWTLNDFVTQNKGCYTATGNMRDGEAAIHNAYIGTDFNNPGPIPRPETPILLLPDAAGAEQILLNAQLPGVVAQWPPFDGTVSRAINGTDIKVEAAGTTYNAFWGSILSSQAFSVDMSQEVDLRLNIRDVQRVWYGYLHLDPNNNDSGIRVEYDSALPGEYVYNLKHYVPEEMRQGIHSFKFRIGVASGDPPLPVNNGSILCENISVVTGTTRTPEPTLPAGMIWADHYKGTMWVQPQGWRDENDDAGFNAHIAYSAYSSLASITRTVEGDGWGKVQSPLITANVDDYPVVGFKVNRISAGDTWKLEIREKDSQSKYTLQNSTSNTGEFAYDFSAATGWTGIKQFNLELVVEGASGKYIETDYLWVGQAGSVMGSAVNPTTPPVPSATFTTTPTPMPTSTSISTSSPTPTSTPTPWLGKNQVMAYPNPSRGT